ncbi:hypothetical protein [Streptomyces sp. Tue6028]|uniref:hypothetical protein n=1 Tax=Streptomyces sp. Tue6028 TaxID=2036037 RepID=UPI003EB8768F
MELDRTDRPIAGIATEAGFADQRHLTRMMRRYRGVTPQSWPETASPRRMPWSTSRSWRRARAQCLPLLIHLSS